jgi:hypothetical protein
MFTASTEHHKRAVYFRGTVACITCGQPIHVYKVAGLADEISLSCAKCGTRRFYDRRAVMVEELPERRRRPRR